MDDTVSQELIMSSPGGYGVWTAGELDLSAAFEDMYPKVPGLRRYTECSSRGVCDYAEGVCQCFEGYEGKACRRTSCPNDCSGHGRCLTNVEVDFMYTSHTPFNDQFWDKDLTQQCVCDRGFEGWDCSQRSCPVGDDPTTACSEHVADDYQLVFVMRSNLAVDEYFTLAYKDNFGGEFTTRPIKAEGCSANSACPEVQYALLELPNMAIPQVEVRCGRSPFLRHCLPCATHKPTCIVTQPRSRICVGLCGPFVFVWSAVPELVVVTVLLLCRWTSWILGWARASMLSLFTSTTPTTRANKTQ